MNFLPDALRYLLRVVAIDIGETGCVETVHRNFASVRKFLDIVDIGRKAILGGNLL
jgi:hypothetical protein